MSDSTASIIQFLKNKEQQKKMICLELFNRAADDMQRMVNHIKINYPGIIIYQWGSLLNSNNFDENSDIDIAVEGVKSSKEFFKMYGELTKMTDFPLDLVELDRIDPIHRESILERGCMIHGG